MPEAGASGGMKKAFAHIQVGSPKADLWIIASTQSSAAPIGPAETRTGMGTVSAAPHIHRRLSPGASRLVNSEFAWGGTA